MEQNQDGPHARIKARDAAMRLMNRLTASVAFAAIGGVGVFGLVSAHTVPSSYISTTTATTTTTTTSGSSSSSAVQASSSSVKSTAKSGVTVSGGS